MSELLKFRIHKEPSPDRYPWYYEVPGADDTYDYGNMASHAEAVEAVDEAVRFRRGKVG